MSFTLMTRAVPVVARQQRRRTVISGVAASLSSSSSSYYSSAYFTSALPTSSPYSYLSPLSITNHHHQNQIRQQRQQQIRSYLFIPMSWPELKERAERWLEKTESRIIKVRLLNRQRLQKLQQLRRRKRDRDRDDNENNVNVVRPRPIVTPITPTAATATATNSSSNKIRIKYQGWKIRQKDQYVSWKSRRKDQYTKRKDQYVSWKSRRRDQYVRYWTKDDNTTSSSRIKMKDKLKLTLWGRKNILVEEYSKPEWFDSKTGYPLTSKDSTGERYVNPWQSQSTNGVQSISAIFEWQCQRFIRTIRRSLALPLLLSSISTTTTTATATTRSSLSLSDDNNDNNDYDSDNISPLSSQTIQPLPLLLNPNLSSESSSRSNELYMTWIGHSTCLFQMRSGSGSQSGQQSGQRSGQNYSNDYWSILTDPMFSTRASPYKHWIGIPRDVQPAYTIQDIINHQQQQQQQQCTRLGGQEEITNNKEEAAHAQALVPGLLDICCITHDHYDHMDMNSVRELKDHVQLWIVPLGIADWLVERCAINRKQIIELEWWQNVRISRSKKKTNKNGRRRVVIIDDDDDVGGSSNTNDGNGNDSDSDNNEILTVTCCPASHWSGRTILDRNKRLWCSFAISLSTTSAAPAPSASASAASASASASASALSSLSSYESESKSRSKSKSNSLLSSSNTNTEKLFDIFFCGDTSYPNNFPLFRQIGDALGPFDLSCIPIGAYLPKEMNKDAHCDPYEALQIHNDIQSKHSIAIHWGSFNLGEEPLYEPPQLLYDAILKQEETEKKKLKQKQKQQRVDNNDDDDKEVSSCPSIKFDVLRHGESRKII